MAKVQKVTAKVARAIAKAARVTAKVAEVITTMGVVVETHLPGGGVCTARCVNGQADPDAR
jgi:hypothetical protein